MWLQSWFMWSNTMYVCINEIQHYYYILELVWVGLRPQENGDAAVFLRTLVWSSCEMDSLYNEREHECTYYVQRFSRYDRHAHTVLRRSLIVSVQSGASWHSNLTFLPLAAGSAQPYEQPRSVLALHFASAVGIDPWLKHPLIHLSA